jgi:hypothetical protein
MVFFADRSNEGLKSMGLNFTGANWVNFFLQGPKSKLENFTGTKSTIYPIINFEGSYANKFSYISSRLDRGYGKLFKITP